MDGFWLWPILLVTIVQKGGLVRQSGYQDLILFVMVGSQQANQEKKIKREAKSHVHAYLRCSMLNWKSINKYILNYKFAIVKCLEIWIKENPPLERWKFPYPFGLPHFRHALIISIFLIWFSSTILFLMQLIKKKLMGHAAWRLNVKSFRWEMNEQASQVEEKWAAKWAMIVLHCMY